MPTSIDGFQEIDDEEFEQIMREMRKAQPSYLHPSMVDLMAALTASDKPLLIRLRDTQNPRSVRSAIMNVARHRGLRVQSASGDQIVAVRRLGFVTDETPEREGMPDGSD
jgi:predicted transcriptional regulator